MSHSDSAPGVTVTQAGRRRPGAGPGAGRPAAAAGGDSHATDARGPPRLAASVPVPAVLSLGSADRSTSDYVAGPLQALPCRSP